MISRFAFAALAAGMTCLVSSQSFAADLKITIDSLRSDRAKFSFAFFPRILRMANFPGLREGKAGALPEGHNQWWQSCDHLFRPQKWNLRGGRDP